MPRHVLLLVVQHITVKLKALEYPSTSGQWGDALTGNVVAVSDEIYRDLRASRTPDDRLS